MKIQILVFFYIIGLTLNSWAVETEPTLKIIEPIPQSTIYQSNQIVISGHCTPGYGVRLVTQSGEFSAEKEGGGLSFIKLPNKVHVFCDSDSKFKMFAQIAPITMASGVKVYTFGAKTLTLQLNDSTGAAVKVVQVPITLLEPPLVLEVDSAREPSELAAFSSYVNGQGLYRNLEISGKCTLGAFNVNANFEAGYSGYFSSTAPCSLGRFKLAANLENKLFLKGSLVTISLSQDSWGKNRVEKKMIFPLLESKPQSALQISVMNRQGPLIIFNLNSEESVRLARFYQTKRNLPESSLCGVSMPQSQYADASEYDGMRRQIIRNCACRDLKIKSSVSLLPSPAPGASPSSRAYTRLCSMDNFEAAETGSTINALIIMKGLPSRLTFNEEDPSLDGHLSRFLFSPDKDTFLNRPSGTSSTPILMRESKTPIPFGRIEATTELATQDLILRTIAAEKLGFQGNVIVSGDLFMTDFAMDSFSGERGSADCSVDRNNRNRADQVKLSIMRPWDLKSCRVAENKVPGPDGVTIPGTDPAEYGSLNPNSVIPRPINIGGFFGGDTYADSNQMGFSGSFKRMLEWRKTTSACIPLCKNFASEDERAQCRISSTDVLKEINSNCVGTAPGAIGHIVRSYPVMTAGLYPHGWNTAGMGHIERVAPELMKDETAFKNSTFSDNSYIRFGSPTWANGKKDCLNSLGVHFLCPPKIPIYLTHFQNINLKAKEEFQTRLRLRPSVGTTGKIYVWTGFYHGVATESGATVSSGLSVVGGSSHEIDLAKLIPGQWNDVQFSEVPSSTASAEVALVTLVSQFHMPTVVQGSVDIDGVELLANKISALDTSIGSFSHTVESTAYGDWASLFMDRLGGVAWWGSGSHYRSAGYAFTNSKEIMRRWVQGESLGAAVTTASLVSTSSGLLFGDPLYSPSGVKFTLGNEANLYLDPALKQDGIALNGYQFKKSEPATWNTALRVSGKHGRFDIEKRTRINWIVEICHGESHPSDCTLKYKWKPLANGRQNVENFVLKKDLLSLVTDQSKPDRIMLRMKLQNSQNPNAFYGMGYLEYSPN